MCVCVCVFSSWLSEGDVGKVGLVDCNDSFEENFCFSYASGVIFSRGKMVHLLSTKEVIFGLQNTC